MTRKFEIKDAVRENVPLLLSMSGASGGGKTVSALRLAHGIQDIVGGEIVMVDTDNGRALSYSGLKVTGAERPFKFKHIRFDPPYGSLDYIEAIDAARTAKPTVIIVDQGSSEHEGEGGHLEAHEREVDRMAGKDWRKREAVNVLAWAKPKADRRKLIQYIQRLDVHTIFCFRAKMGVKPIKTEGRTEFVQQGFMPIAGDELVFEMLLNALLLPNSGGVAKWDSEFMGERMMTKLPEQFLRLKERTTPIDEELGRQFAKWAQGGAPRPPNAKPVQQESQEIHKEEVVEQEAPAAAVPQPAPTVEETAPSIEPASPASDAGTVSDPGTPGSGEPTTAAEATTETGTKTSRKQSKDGSYSVVVQFAEPGALPDTGETYMIGHVTYDGTAWVAEVERHKEGALLFWRDGVDAGRVDKATAPSTIWAYMDHRPRPTSTASAPPAEAEAATSASATPASPSSQEAVSGPTAGQRQSSAAAGPDVPPEFAAYALALAKAEDWPTGIRDGAIKPLKQSAAWPKAPLELQIRAHQMAFSRLEDLIGDGYRFDFINDLHAYRAYIDQEWDPDALEGNRRTACRGPVWDALPPAAREQFARAHEAQLARIKTRQQVIAAGGEYA